MSPPTTIPVRITLDVDVIEGTDLYDLAERVFDMVGNDPEHLTDEIVTVTTWDVAVLG